MTILGPAPPGFIAFTLRYPAEVRTGSAQVLPDVCQGAVQNAGRVINGWIKPVNPARTAEHGANTWSLCVPGDSGSCREYACTKRHELTKTFPTGAFALAWCHRDADPANTNHLVLLVNFVSGIYVLDNLTDIMWPIEKVGYAWLSRQEWGSPQTWVPLIVAKRPWWRFW